MGQKLHRVGGGNKDESTSDGGNSVETPTGFTSKGGLGGLPEPGHIAVKGPCVLRRPVSMMEIALRQTAQILNAIFLNF